MVFWFNWLALMFNGPYIKIRNWIMQRFCVKRYQAMLAREAAK